MAKEKHYIFSARTTEEGLRQLGELKAKLNVGCDDLVIDAVCAHYNLEKATMALPRKEKPDKAAESSEPPTKEQPSEEQPDTQAEKPAKKQSKVGKGKK
jgi:hypothetical protein